MKIYIKPFCSFCARLIELLDQEGLSYEKIDVIKNPDMRAEMEKKSGQGGVPEVEIANVIIPDYGTEETLVADIKKILEFGTVTSENKSQLTSTIVFLA